MNHILERHRIDVKIMDIYNVRKIVQLIKQLHRTVEFIRNIILKHSVQLMSLH